MAYEFIELNKENDIALLTIARPKALNALNGQVLKELDQCLNEVQEDKTIRALIITGSGEKAFVAGADIKEINQLDQASALEFANNGQTLFTKIETLRVPVIAALNGFALGGGLELALSCDFIYASDNAKLGLPECTLGLIPGFGGTVRLARKIGPGLAKEWTMTGNPVDAAEAHRVGLVNKVCPQNELLETAKKTAATMAKRAPLAVTAIKTAINVTYGLNTKEAMAIEGKEFSDLFTSQDVKEGTTAFIEKRKPEFKGL